MAVIQKIRSYGVVLICVVGLALFAFIAEELVRAISTTRNVGRQTVGSIYGKSVSYQEFNELYAEYENAVKMSNGGQNLTDVQTMQLRDQVWNDLVTQRAIEHEAELLGLRVTDAEVESLINTGQSSVLRQTPFVNQQTGQFDSGMLKQFLSNYNEVINNPDYPEAQKDQFRELMTYWQFVEKQVRQQALAQKYEALLEAALIANPVSAEAAFAARQNNSTILMAALPYSSVKDADAEISDREVKAKYDEMKRQYPDMFEMPAEMRDLKYIAVPVVASEADEKALEEELATFGEEVEAEGANIANIIRESRSLVTYNGLKVSKKSLPSDIASLLDSTAVGQLVGPYKNAQDGTMNVVKLIAKAELPDSVEFQRIDIPGTDEAAKHTADSLYQALQAGAVIDSVAKGINQSGQPQWITSANVDQASLNDENRDFVTTLFTTPSGQLTKVETTGGTIIMKITDRRNMMDKYDVCVIKRQIDFSDETHNTVYNKFSSFLAANPKAEDLVANAAQNGYTVRESPYTSAASHLIGNIHGTTDALRWAFDEAKKGDVSALYECGTNNNELLVVVVSEVHKKGARSLEDQNLRMAVEQEAVKDKKAALLSEKMSSAKSVADVAKLEGAVTDTIQGITFSSPVFVYKTASSEPALAGAVSASKQGEFVSGVRGDGGVYAFQVLEQTKQEGKIVLKEEQAQLTASYLRNLSGLMSSLVKDAKVVDNRYKFYQ